MPKQHSNYQEASPAVIVLLVIMISIVCGFVWMVCGPDDERPQQTTTEQALSPTSKAGGVDAAEDAYYGRKSAGTNSAKTPNTR